MLKVKIVCNVFVKMPKKSITIYCDELTCIIQTSQTSDCAFRKKKPDGTGKIKAEEERGSAGYRPEGFTKFGP